MTYLTAPIDRGLVNYGEKAMIKRTIGIDLAIRGDQVAQIFDDGKPVGKPIRFRLTSESLTSFVQKVTADLPPGATIQALMEPTGMSWFPIAVWLARAGAEAIRVKGKRVKALRRYLSEHAKTDNSDAHTLGAMPSYGSPTFDPVHIPSPKQHALQRLTKQRARYQDAICCSKRRLLDLIRWACPALEAVLPDLRTRLSLALLGHFLDPNAVLGARRSTLARFIGTNASGNHPHSGPFVDQLIDRLKMAARETLALHRNAIDFTDLQFEVRHEVDQCIRLLDAVAELDKRIDALYRELHPTDALRSIPGVGLHLAPILLGMLHTVDRFRGERHVRGFCGLFPTRSASGGVERPGQQLTKAGNDRIKKALFLAADTARKIDPQLAKVYWRLMVQKGHHHKQALCAVATRLVNRIFCVLKSGRPYVLQDDTGAPIGIAQAKAVILERFTVPADIRSGRCRNRLVPVQAGG
jgi:transposase